ncbi:hypothetical protein Q3G72_029522 [Acer saccharum]|nr:hypothetical protein Q3G72_029522 [Acer saccharum]
MLDMELKHHGKHKMALSLSGKMLSTKLINGKAFMSLIARVWQVRECKEIENVSRNVFTFTFMNEEDKRKVLAGGHWTFDRSLIVLEEPTGMKDISLSVKVARARRVGFRLIVAMTNAEEIEKLC